MELILVRHGETDGNAKRQYIGRTDLPLNEAGRLQAQALAQTLAGRRVDRVLHSPSRRAEETAAFLLEGRELQAMAEPRWAELDFGAWEALTYEEIERRDRDRLWAWYDDPWQVAPPGGETLRALDARLGAWLASMEEEAGTVLVVTHGGPIRWFLAKLARQDARLFSSISIRPGACVICRRHDGSWEEIG